MVRVCPKCGKVHNVNVSRNKNTNAEQRQEYQRSFWPSFADLSWIKQNSNVSCESNRRKHNSPHR